MEESGSATSRPHLNSSGSSNSSIFASLEAELGSDVEDNADALNVLRQYYKESNANADHPGVLPTRLPSHTGAVSANPSTMSTERQDSTGSRKISSGRWLTAIETDIVDKENHRSYWSKSSSIVKKLFMKRAKVNDYGGIVGKHFVLIGAIVLYSLIGGAIFYNTEGTFEAGEKHKEDVARQIEEMTAKVAKVVEGRGEQFNASTFRSGVHQVLLEQFGPSEPVWTLANSILYSFTLYSTIGYGHIYPTTSMGRIFTVAYALVGIPLMLSVMATLGQSLLLVAQGLTSCTRRALSDSPSEHKASIPAASGSRRHFHLVPTILMVVVYFFLSSLIYYRIDSRSREGAESEWDYGLAMYFMFITLTTIGLGDVTPLKGDMVATFGLMVIGILGLGVVSMFVAIIQQRIESRYLKALKLMEKAYEVNMRHMHGKSKKGKAAKSGHGLFAKYRVPLVRSHSEEHMTPNPKYKELRRGSHRFFQGKSSDADDVTSNTSRF